ncbi:calpain family cysteine protease protein [Rutstroemia sp. NJR-2017a BBW]|nr:calpain family cysteine protease protein [Rutstroemia sp. NJR-2017a BBW]
MSSSPGSSDTDQSRRRRRNPPGPPPPPAPWANGNKPKKKKKQLAPQATIDKLWSRFSVSKFSKATKILPSAAPSSKGTSASTVIIPPPVPQNLLVSQGYDRAVQECRTKVHKLIRECRRVNMRYRDPTFDIDWDLKWERGDCLNSLTSGKFEVYKHLLLNPSSVGPKAVKRVHEIFEKPTFLKDKISPADVKQGSLGDCWLMASLTALANMENGIQRICVEWDTNGEWIISIIDDKLYLKSPDWDSPSVHRHLLEQTDREDVEKEYRKTYQTGSEALYFARCKDPNATWLPLLEKAYAKAHGDFASLEGGWIGEGLEDLTGGVTTELLTSDILDIDEFWHNEVLKVNKEFLFGCSTGVLDRGYGSRNGITEGHAYVIMEARELSTGERLLKLRNPWGKGKKGNWEGPWSDGSKEFTPDAQKELNHKFGNDSVFWISYEDLLRKYQHFDRTRLFMDCPDWRLTQKWISVDVPWRSEFEQRFTLTLQKESPVVLVMSQLDDRYFAGLCGQYQFRLQFRLHEIGSLDEEDYIVRSHGNYLMNRSVVSELKSLPAGTYSVFLMVVAERNKDDLTVEDIVKAQLRRKEDNDKLEQVGAAYDMAHGKALPYMEARAKAKEAHNKNKAKEARIAQRKVLWEKRHTTRQIVRKQEKKNREKREAKEAKEAAAEKEKEDRKPKDSGVQTEEVVEKQIEKHDKSIQTEEHPPQAVETKIDTQVLRDTDKAVQTDDISLSCIGSQATPTTSKSDNSSPESPYVIIRHTDRRSHGAPPPPPAASYYNRRDSAAQRDYGHPPPPPPPRNYVTSEGESSASPISDYDMYSDEDPSLKMRNPNSAPGEQSKSKEHESDGEEEQPDPWNAVCVIGFRVYSKDEGLVLKVYDEYLSDEEATVKGSEEDANDGDVEDALDHANSQENKGREDESTKASGEEPNPAPLTPSNTIDESINRPASIETRTQAPPGERNIVEGGREVALVDESALKSKDSNVECEGELL